MSRETRRMRLHLRSIAASCEEAGLELSPVRDNAEVDVLQLEALIEEVRDELAGLEALLGRVVEERQNDSLMPTAAEAADLAKLHDSERDACTCGLLPGDDTGHEDWCNALRTKGAKP